MKTIWKFQLDEVARQILRLPRGARFLSAGTEGHAIFAWALLDTEEAAWGCYVAVHLVETGGRLDEEASACVYLSTVQLPTGTVYHVFVAREVASPVPGREADPEREP